MSGDSRGEILNVLGLEKGFVAYNPCPLGDGILAARVESADSDWLNRVKKTGGPYNPSCRFFELKNNELHLIEDAPVFEGCEDPSGAWINVKGEKRLLFQAVTGDFDAPGGAKIWTNLYIAPNIRKLSPNNPIALLPGKDNRFCQSQIEGDLVWLSRPDKGEAFPGRISFTRLNIEEILTENSDMIIKSDTKLLKLSITEGQQGEFVKVGANAVYSEIVQTEAGGKEVFRVVCHGATSETKPVEKKLFNAEDDPFVSDKIHYKAYEGVINPEKLDEVIELQGVAEASDFSLTSNQIKAERYADVVFPGGIMDGYLYCGVGDRSIGRIKL